RTVLETLAKGPFAREAETLLAQEKLRATRGRSETTDHPPIYPTGLADPKKLRGDRAQIYELVVRRFLATVAPDALYTKRRAELSLREEPFRAEGSHLDDPGWYTYYPYATPIRDVELPLLSPEEVVRITKVGVQEDQTQPPRRFGQGSLIQEMERLGLGTKSTRHDIL
ncbi:DNA topoisomerase, type IA, central domain protein, partial [mine drainage metagenome]